MLFIILPFISIALASNPPECGSLGPENAARVIKVLGGNEITAAALPFIVLVLIQNSPCTGTLISRRHVITAAHCLESDCKWPIFSHYGDSGITVCHGTDDVSHNCTAPGNSRYSVKKVYFFDEYWNYGGCPDELDKVILELDRDVDSGVPVCLPSQENRPFQSSPPHSLFIAGYGNNNDAKGEINTKLRFANTGEPIGAPCNPNTHICTSWSSSRSAICSGDSGGPLLELYDGHFYLVGINTFSEGGFCFPSGTRSNGRQAFQGALRVDVFLNEIKRIIHG